MLTGVSTGAVSAGLRWKTPTGQMHVALQDSAKRGVRIWQLNVCMPYPLRLPLPHKARPVSRQTPGVEIDRTNAAPNGQSAPGQGKAGKRRANVGSNKPLY